MSLPVVCAGAGAEWEARLIAELASPSAPLTVTRRCVDVIELVAVAALGHSVAALLDPRLRHLDPDVVERLRAAAVVPVGLTGADHSGDIEVLRAVGIDHVVPADAPAAVIAEVVLTAIADLGTGEDLVERAFSDPMHASGRLIVPAASTASGSTGPLGSLDERAADPPQPAERGRVIAVWGPSGSPGRTMLATNLADALARRGLGTMLIDADVYGGVIASTLGLLDESPGLAAACRQAQSRRLDAAGLAALAWQVSPTLRVLTGLSRADRWPELRSSALEDVLMVCRELTEVTVLDVGFCLESDEELSFDSTAPRRNGATLAALACADVVLIVGSADPIGIQRLARGMTELREIELRAELTVVLNRVRAGAAGRDPAAELTAALQRFVGLQASALLPFDLDAADRAVSLGKTLAEVAPASPLTRAVANLADRFAGPARLPTGGRRRHRAGRRGTSRRAEYGVSVTGSDDA